MAKMGRPHIDLDWKKIDTLCAYRMSKEDIAFMSNCSQDKLEIEIKKNFGCTFSAYRLKKLSATKAKLIEKAIQKALAGDNTMLIFSLKNLCKWCDNPSEGYKTLDD